MLKLALSLCLAEVMLLLLLRHLQLPQQLLQLLQLMQQLLPQQHLQHAPPRRAKLQPSPLPTTAPTLPPCLQPAAAQMGAATRAAAVPRTQRAPASLPPPPHLPRR